VVRFFHVRETVVKFPENDVFKNIMFLADPVLNEANKVLDN
jgi:hypothetical protein